MQIYFILFGKLAHFRLGSWLVYYLCTIISTFNITTYN